MAGIFCLAIWVPTKSYGVLVFFAIIGGTCVGTFWTTIGPVGAEVVGLKELPSALSLTWLVLVLPTTCKFPNIQNLCSASRAKGAVSEPIALQLRQSTGNIYLHAQIFAGLMYVAAALCMWAVRAWKVSQIQQDVIEHEKSFSDKAAVPLEAAIDVDPGSTAKAESSIVKRLLAWQRV